MILSDYFIGEQFMSSNMIKYFAEFLGTLLLVVGGVGSAVLAGSSIGFIGVAFAFGFTLTLLAYCIGPISGCHVNPAVTLGLYFARKFPLSQVIPYILVQLIGAVAGAAIIYVIASGKTGFNVHEGFAANGFGEHSPGGYSALSAAITEILLTALLVFVVLNTTRSQFPSGCNAFAVGITLVVIHLVSIPVTNTSVNFARSLGSAVFIGGPFLTQLWLFAVAHVIAALVAALIYQGLYPTEKKSL